MPIQRALISVSDKTHLVPFARRLVQAGTELISTGGTQRALEEAGLPVTAVQEVTGLPEILGDRVKTLHPKIHGGLLARRDEADHVRDMETHGIPPIDLVCVNLYPFEQTVERAEVTEAEAIEQIDIGGPSMVRSAAKNHRYVTVVTDPRQYDRVIADLDAHGDATTSALRRELAEAAFARTAAYDQAIARWLSGSAGFPETLSLGLRRTAELRYGENPHQRAALYTDPLGREPSPATAKQHHGKELSYNNLTDADGALEVVKEFAPEETPAAAVIKHANPCGLAIGSDAATAFRSAYAGDPVAAFGGIVALNCAVDASAAEAIAEGQKFVEVIIAPRFAAAALERLRERWSNVRLLETGPLPHPSGREATEKDCKRLTGGMLVQDRDLAPIDPDGWHHAAGPPPGEEALADMRVAMVAAKHLRSNAIAVARGKQLVGVGAGQMDRLQSCGLATEKAGDRASGGAAASDAFFPFRDGPDTLIRAGVRAIVHPGGSKRDAETQAACEEADVTLMLTGRRHFRH